jgi:hypothetical protein
MRNLHRSSKLLAVLATVIGFCVASYAQYYVVTNDDNDSANTATIYRATGSPANPSLTQVRVVKTGGKGLGGGYFANVGVNVVSDSNGVCAYISNSGSSNITGYNPKTNTVTGPFSGSPGDNSASLGLALVLGGDYLYAAFTASNTLATFKISSGCQLTFVSDTSAIGLNGGSLDGLKTHGNLLAVAFGDGSYQSFNISGGTPVSNNDRQISAGDSFGDVPAGVDISSDGKWAVFGDATFANDVEVAAITASGLGPTTAYPNLGAGSNSNTVWFSPDNTLVYVSNTYSGQITVDNFDSSTGTLSLGCISNVLNKYDQQWEWNGVIQTAGTTGTGTVLWEAEFGTPSSNYQFSTPGSIAIVEVSRRGSSCTLTEAASSPITDSNSNGILSIAAFPPRKF